MPGPSDAAQDRRTATVVDALSRALKNFDPLTLQQDLAQLKGDRRRRAALARQISELLDRLQTEPLESALSRPLGLAWTDGFRVPAQPQTSNLKPQTAVSVESVLDADKLRSLVRALTDPLVDALHRARSPLPYILPKLVQKDQRSEFLGAAVEAAAQGFTSKQFSKLLAQRGTFSRQVLTDAAGGPFVEFPNGFRLPVDTYLETISRTTMYWASNRGVLDRCAAAGTEYVEVVGNPWTVDFCLLYEGKVFALSESAARAAGCPQLAACPNGGPPFHPNCRHSAAPYVWLGEKLPAVKPIALHEKASVVAKLFGK